MELGLAGEHVERVDEVVVLMGINTVEVGAEAQFDDLELWELTENPMVSLGALDSFTPVRAEGDNAIHRPSMRLQPASGLHS